MRHVSSVISLVLILLLLLNMAAMIGVFEKFDCEKSDLGLQYLQCEVKGEMQTYQKTFKEANK